MYDWFYFEETFDNFVPFMEELSGRILLSSNLVNSFRSLDKQKPAALSLSSRIPEILIPCFILVNLAEEHGISVILLLWCFLRTLIFFFPFVCLAVIHAHVHRCSRLRIRPFLCIHFLSLSQFPSAHCRCSEVCITGEEAQN